MIATKEGKCRGPCMCLLAALLLSRCAMMTHESVVQAIGPVLDRNGNCAPARQCSMPRFAHVGGAPYSVARSDPTQAMSDGGA